MNKETTVINNVLIPTDGSECATAALERGVSLAADLKAKVTFLMVREPFRMLSAESAQIERVKSEFTQYETDRARGVLERATAIAAKAGVACAALQVEHARPYEAIIEAARKCEADIIAMGSHGLGGVRAVVLGSVTQKVLTHCLIPVLVYR
ncbi:universal stress protein [Bordetella genomosp. 10]|uniref:Universal stress protein n=1 Tax=Bordetella genomosp. 10 TaxID=1416804 RepID=A0A261S538_9BORD|nr:universal stress protein [Bordetella genomosp. 10]